MSNERQLADRCSRDRILSDLDQNLLVEAGAGSGKTHEMSRRMAAGIAGGVYQIEHISAVTFTRKAAAELRGRFQLALEKELERTRGLQEDSPDRGARLQMALSNLERFFAGTIHSFCARLLRERPVEAGVSPGFTELDEAADALLRKRSLRDYLAGAKAAGDTNVLELFYAGIKPKDLDKAFEIMYLYEDVEFPPGDALQPDTTAEFDALDKFWAKLCRKLPSAIPAATNCPTQKCARRFYGQMRVAKSRRTRPDTLASLLESWDFDPKITQKWWAGDAVANKILAAEITGMHKTFRADVVRPFLNDWRQYIYRLSITLLTNARQHARNERMRLNSLNYGDLLQLAALVLRTNAEVRRALQQKYRWLFVDEFQDTDPVQAEIIFLLASDETKADKRSDALASRGAAGRQPILDWRSTPLRPGSLFVVGDPKQSIYRFRRADIDIYNVVRHRLIDKKSGDVLSLTANFRSVPALCDWANAVFRLQFPSKPTPHSPRFAPLDAHRAKGPIEAADGVDARASGVYTLTVPSSIAQTDVAVTEALMIARFIRSEVDAGRRSFGDFLVLTCKRSRLSCYADALEDLHIPVEVSGAGAFGNSKEVEQLALLLRVLTDPQDGVSLVGLLRGPLFGISDEELFTFRQAGGWFNIFSGHQRNATAISSGVSSGVSDLDPVSRALQSLHEMFRWTRTLPAGAALDRILEFTGYLALAATTPDGVKAGNLIQAVDRVRLIVEQGESLAGAASALETDFETSSEIESLPLEPGRSDVVRIMNLHKAKGLEAPVVFLADPCGGMKPVVDIRIVREGLTARGYFRITSKVGAWGMKIVGEPAGWDVHEAQEKLYLEAEGQRLLYVAGTRARDLLIVGRWAKSGGQNTRAWGAFEESLVGTPELTVPAIVNKPAAQPGDLSKAAITRARTLRADRHQKARMPSWSTSSVTAEARHIAKITRDAETELDDPTRTIVAHTPSHRADAGMAWGTLIHGLLEHAMRHKSATREDFVRLAMWLTFEQQELRPVVEEAVSEVQAFTASAFWQLASSSDHLVEVPFLFAQDQTSLLGGVIDLVFKNGDDWEIVDYKTDLDQDENRSAHRYAYQLAAYQKALSSLGIENIRASIRSVRSTRAELKVLVASPGSTNDT